MANDYLHSPKKELLDTGRESSKATFQRRREEMVGMIFGRVKVVEALETQDNQGYFQMLCECFCGTGRKITRPSPDRGKARTKVYATRVRRT